MRGLTTLIISLLAPLPAVAGTVPKFSDYAVAEVFSGKRATVDLDSAPGARMFRTRLREAAAKSPNFAGYFVVASWGCGTGCQDFAVIDLRSGRVTFGPVTCAVGQDFRLNSRLLVVDPPNELLSAIEGGSGCGSSIPKTSSQYFEWDGTRFLPVGEFDVCREEP